MKIVIICGTAPPEPVTAGRVHYDLAGHLSNENKVWLITPKPSRPLGTHYPEVKDDVVNRISDTFYHIQLNSFTYPEYNVFLRSYESTDFGIKAIRYVNRKIREYDLIYASPWPFFCQLMIVLLRRNKKVPLIMNVQDLYPESFFIKIKSKVISWIFNPFFYIDKLIARKSTHLTVVSESLRQVYIKKRNISKSRVSVVPNWQDHEEFISCNISREEVIKKYNLCDTSGKFIYMYLGNIGPVAGVDTILHSFSRLNMYNSYLIIAGSGSVRGKCQLLAKKLEMTNLAFIEVPPGLKSVVELQSISDVLLLPINPEAANSSIPSKLIAYMFSGKPVITSAGTYSETAMAVKDSGCGWITRSNESADWADVMKAAYNTPEKIRRSMGKTGFDYAIANYSRTEGLKRICYLIANLNSL